MNEVENSGVLPVVVTPLRLEDLDELMSLEQASFALPWPRSVYRYELTQNPNGYYLAVRPVARFTTLPALLAYGGLWLLEEEAHICTLATHPSFRRHGLGEWLLLHLLDLSRSVGAERATLEVRASNLTAQRLYRRTGFEQTGVRRRYYSDNNEDALIMATPSLRAPAMQRLLAQRRAIVSARLRAWGRELMREHPSEAQAREV
ncbi:MAG: ribosomal protein S18-alanine N-acetyltransferase [Anaerolineae bacterium]|nr:ribosomal protein S18-alanine N-acetyltransferase [Anaerolineae bacterium]MDW8101019.1 ribosomal protein S18-alanine N-acetyltransferase [Anaerolineae bacterium]